MIRINICVHLVSIELDVWVIFYCIIALVYVNAEEGYSSQHYKACESHSCKSESFLDHEYFEEIRYKRINLEARLKMCKEYHDGH